MARDWKFETAFEFVRRWSGKDTDAAGVSDDYMDAEEFILDSPVQHPEQMAKVIEVVIDNVIGGTRSDGRDVRALQGLMNCLRQSSGATGISGT